MSSNTSMRESLEKDKRVYRAQDIPRDDVGLTSWLYDVYAKKDAMLDYYYKEGRLPDEIINAPSELPQIPLSVLKFDLLDQLLSPLFYCSVCSQVFLKYARKNGYPVLQHTTLPRIGAVKTILDTVGVPQQASDNVEPNGNYQIKDSSKPLEWVIDMTIAYKDRKALDMLGMVVGLYPQSDVLVHYR
uniref:Acyltransferase C-terminal domain-containing protein n=1 Tax=Biomphalaria glabrata TaxID=6526 RepID=A0A2C9L0Q4_BIOGL